MATPLHPEHLSDVLSRRGASLAAGIPHGVHIVDEMTEPGQSIFASAAPSFHRLGWSVFPQTRRAGRTPAIVYGRAIRPKELDLANRQANDADMRDWVLCAPRENVAAVMGRGSGMFAVDVDVNDPETSHRMQIILHEALGTSFVRAQAQSSKVSLYYRIDPSDPVDVSRRLEVLDGEGNQVRDYAVEILTNGRPSTVYGRHHGSGCWFQYGKLHPMRHQRSAAAMVSKAKLQHVLQRISDEVTPLGKIKVFDRAAPFLATGAVEGATVGGGIVTPGGRTAVRDVTYSKGKVTDGRETWLRNRAVAWCLSNPTMAATDPGRRALAEGLAREAAVTWDGLGSKFRSPDEVMASALQRVCSAHEFIARTPDLVRRVGREEGGAALNSVRVAVKVQRDESVGGLAWLSDDLLGSVSLGRIDADGMGDKAIERALVMDDAVRAAGQERVAAGVRTAVNALIDQAYDRARGDEVLRPLGLLRAPTGAGKTSTAIERIAEAKRRRGPVGKPILVLMPSYNNIEESIARARGQRRGGEVTTRFQANAGEATREAEGLGLDVAILTGRERGGCRMAKQMRLLSAAQVNASGLCSGTDEGPVERDICLKANRGRKGGQRESAPKAFCRHHPTVGGDCPVILARRALREADVVFAPLSFIANQFPGELKDAFAAVVIDERVVFELLHVNTFPVSTLERERAAPPILEADRERDGQDVTGEHYLAERAVVARVAVEALKKGADVAAAIMAHPNAANLCGMVRSAVTVCGRGQRTAQEVKPNMSVKAVAALVSTPKAVNLREEAKFWRLVEERLDLLAADALMRDLAGGSPDPALLKAKGDRDVRIQRLAEGTLGTNVPASIRLSWRGKPNLAELPLLLLDASADVDMVRKVWGDREVVVHEVSAYLHLRTVAVMDSTYSTSSLDPANVQVKKRAEKIEKRLVKVRRAEAVLSTVYGQGRVLTTAPLRIRKALRIAYGEAENIDTGHFGALRGLDFAKRHMAVLTVGRHECPTHVVDAVAAALTYDDDQPEAPCDVNGDGLDPKTGAALQPHHVERTYRLRDGRDLKMSVPQMPGRWGAKVQRQFREEEQLQAAGRLRPVYRDGVPPVWVAFSSVLPEDVIIDAVTSLDQIASPRGAGLVLDAIRRVGVVDQDLFYKQARDLSGPIGFGSQLKYLDLDVAGKQSPFGAGLDLWSVTVEGEERRIAVPAWHSDPEGAIREAYGRSGRHVDGARLLAKGSDPEPSLRKAPDKVDAELGTREERFGAEETARVDVIAAKREAVLADPWRCIDSVPTEDPSRMDCAAEVVRATQGSVIPEVDDLADDEPASSPRTPAPIPVAPPEPEPQCPAAPSWPATRRVAPGLAAAPGGLSADVPSAPRLAPGLLPRAAAPLPA